MLYKFAHYYFFAPIRYFIPKDLQKLEKCSVSVWNGYDGDSEIVNELARHRVLKRCITTEIR